MVQQAHHIEFEVLLPSPNLLPICLPKMFRSEKCLYIGKGPSSCAAAAAAPPSGFDAFFGSFLVGRIRRRSGDLRRDSLREQSFIARHTWH